MAELVSPTRVPKQTETLGLVHAVGGDAESLAGSGNLIDTVGRPRGDDQQRLSQLLVQRGETGQERTLDTRGAGKEIADGLAPLELSLIESRHDLRERQRVAGGSGDEPVADRGRSPAVAQKRHQLSGRLVWKPDHTKVVDPRTPLSHDCVH